jgi:uncharacterized protein (TIGR03435 family)
MDAISQAFRPVPRRFMKMAAMVALMATAACADAQQSRPAEFEVASVRLIPVEQTSVPGAVRQSIDAHPGTLTMRNVRMWGLVKWAYDLKEYQISGLERLAIEHYNVVAKAEEGTPVPQLRVMLQKLLASRFKLIAHRETREVPGYDLVVAKGGPKLRTSDPDGISDRDMKGTAILFRKISMLEFADWLSGPMHAPVIEKTGIEGQFDLTIDVGPYQGTNATKDEQEYAFLAALEKQLGLKLQSAKTSVEYFIVDRADKLPADN